MSNRVVMISQLRLISIYHVICRQNVPDEDFQLGEVDASISGTSLEHVCDQFPFCPAESSRYRNIDGKCNNPNAGRGGWGAAGSPMYVYINAIELSFDEEIRK